jgi:hypothetical protein
MKHGVPVAAPHSRLENTFMRQANDDWTEFDWEQALREGDQFAERYFKLLRRFSDLPGANELIARHMGPEFDEDMLALELEDEAAELELDGEPPAGPWDSGSYEDDPEEEGEGEGGEYAEPSPLAYESHPLFMQLRQIALGWCNVYATMLPLERRRAGLKALFHIGRALANLAYSIDEGLYEHPAASIAFGKRSLKNVDMSLGYVDQLVKECPRIRHILNAIREQMLKSADDLSDHIEKCRGNAASDEE